jgi:KDO2-lipid IV(A) lauroyltransferase
VETLLRRLPLGLSRSLGDAIGRVFFALVPYERRKTIATLAAAYPGADPAWVRSTAAGVFGHLGRSGAEFFRMSDLNDRGLADCVAELRGWEHVQPHLDAGRGIVFVTGHLGHWELLGAWTAQRMPVAVVARQLYDDRLEQVLLRRRRAKRMEVFSRNTNVRPILRWLKDGKALGVLADQDTGVDSLYVDFFGRASKTPSGPAVLAQITGAVLLTAWCLRRPDGRYDVEFEAPIPVPPRGEGGAMELWPAVQEYTRRTEAVIRSHPGQWAWNHARWRSPIDKASTGWDPRLAEACQDSMRDWREAGRPALQAPAGSGGA